MSGCQLDSGKGESFSFTGVAPARPTMLQCIDPHPLVFGQHKHGELKKRRKKGGHGVGRELRVSLGGVREGMGINMIKIYCMQV